MSIAKNLNKNLGGKWIYKYPCYWICDDGVRRIIRCSAGVDEFDNSLGIEWYLYKDGEVPERAESYLPSIKFKGFQLK